MEVAEVSSEGPWGQKRVGIAVRCRSEVCRHAGPWVGSVSEVQRKAGLRVGSWRGRGRGPWVARSWRVPAWCLVTVVVGPSLGVFPGVRGGGATSGRPDVQAEGNPAAGPSCRGGPAGGRMPPNGGPSDCGVSVGSRSEVVLVGSWSEVGRKLVGSRPEVHRKAVPRVGCCSEVAGRSRRRAGPWVGSCSEVCRAWPTSDVLPANHSPEVHRRFARCRSVEGKPLHRKSPGTWREARAFRSELRSGARRMEARRKAGPGSEVGRKFAGRRARRSEVGRKARSVVGGPRLRVTRRACGSELGWGLTAYYHPIRVVGSTSQGPPMGRKPPGGGVRSASEATPAGRKLARELAGQAGEGPFFAPFGPGPSVPPPSPDGARKDGGGG